MKKKKILAGVATAAIIAPIVAQASGVNNLNIADKILLADQLPIQIQVGQPVVTKTGKVYSGTRTDTVPATTVATNSPNVTDNVNVIYSIPMSINSTNGKKLNIPNIVVSANPVITYDGPQTPEKEAIAKEIAAQIKSDAYNSGHVNSSYSGVPKIKIHIGNVDWGMTIQPNITIKVGDKIIPVKVPDLKTTTQYTANVYGEIEKPNSDGLIGIQVYTTPADSSKYYYNSTLNPVNSISFNMSIKGSNGKLELNPAYANNPDIKFNPATGDCTVTGSLAKDGKFNNLFKLVPINPNDVVQDSISINPTGVTYESSNGGNQGTKVPGLITTANWGHSSDYTGIPNSKELAGKSSINISNDCTASSGGEQCIPTIVSKSTINFKESPGPWNAVGITYLPGGHIITSIKGEKSTISSDATYMQLTPAQLHVLATGTPSEKLTLVNNILHSVGVSSSNSATGMMLQNGLATPPKGGYNAIMYPLMSDSTGTKYTGGVTYNAITNLKGNNSGLLVAKTLSFAAPMGLTNELPVSSVYGLIKGQDSIHSYNGIVQAILAGNDNSISAQSLSNGSSIFGFYNGVGQSTQVRTGELSHDSSSVSFSDKIGTSIWLSTGPTVNTISQQDNTFQSTWLKDSHIIQAKVFTPDIGGWGNYTDNSVITFNMHTKDFKITGPITIGGTTIPESDIHVEGDKIVITPAKGETFDAGNTFQFPIKFTNPGAARVGYTFSVTGKQPGTDGVSYNIDKKVVDIAAISGSTFKPSTITNTIISSPINGCLHMDDGVSSTNTSDMSALVQNQSNETKHYLTIMQIPKASGDSLPSNEGCPSEGGLGAELQNIETTNCPIYVLPKSALNNLATPGGLKTNEQMNNSTNPFDMKGYAKDIESGKSGWVLYKPGMDLSNIASIAAMPTIPAKSTYTFKYKLKLTGVQNNSFQYTTSGFKYWDLNDGVGSLSNVVTLAPNGTDLTHQWDSDVLLQSNGSTRALTPTELQQKVTFTFNNPATGKNETMTEPLSYLVSHGQDLDPNYDPSPATPTDHLQQEVDLVNDEAGLKAAGYELVKTTVQIGGAAKQEVEAPYFTNQGIAYNTDFTKVVFVLKKITPEVKDQVTVQVNMGTKDKPDYQNVTESSPAYKAKNGDNPGTQAQPGKAGVPETGASDVATPTLKPGYKIDDVIVETQNPDGSWTSTTEGPDFKVPTTLGKTNTHYIYQISKIPTVIVHDTVKVLVNGKTVQPNEGGYVAPQTGKDGDSLTGASGVTTPVIPPHYSIIGLTIQTVKPDGTTVDKTVKATMVNGVLSIPVVQKDGTTKEVPVKDYKVPTTLGKENTNIIYNITKDVKDTLTVRVLKPGTKDTYETVSVGQPGYVAPQTGTEGIPEQGASGIKAPVIPDHYKVDSIYLNGKEVASTPAEVKAFLANKGSVPSKLGNEDANYVYNISPMVGTVTTQVVVEGADEKVIPNDPATQAQKTVQGQDGKTYVGTGIVAKTADTITIGGKQIDLSNPDSVKELKNLGYALVKSTVQTPSDKKPQTTTVSVINSRKVVEGATHIVYTLKKLPMYGGVTVEVKNLTTGKDEVVEHQVQRGKVGEKFSSATTYKAPVGYTLVPSETTLNGKNVTASDIANATIKEDTSNPYNETSTDMTGDQHVVYSIVKNVQDTVTVTVDGKPMTEAVSKLPGGKNLMPQTGKEGTPSGYGMPAGASDVQTPVAPNGYKITSLTIDTLGPDGKAVTKTINTTMVNGVLEIPVVQKDGTTKNVPVSQYTIPTTLGHNDTHFIYNITKEEPVTVKVVTVDANGKPVPANEQVPTTTTNNTKVNGTTATSVQNGLSTDNINSIDSGIVIPKGYHITANSTLNGKPVKVTTTVNKNGETIANIPATTPIGDNGSNIVYTITKNAPKTYTTKITVTDTKGQPIKVSEVINRTITTPAGGTITGSSTTVKIPNGWKIVKVTEGAGLTDSKEDKPKPYTSATDASNGVTTASLTNGIPDVTSDHHIHYIVEKVGDVTVTVNYKNAEGKLVPFTENNYNGKQHLVEGDTTLGGDITGTSIIVPKGYRVVATTVNTPDGKTSNVTDVKVVDGKTTSKTLADTPLQKGTTHVVYTIEKIPTGSVTTTVVGPNGKTFSSNPPKNGSGEEGVTIPNDKTTITPPKGYKVVSVDVNGKEVTPTKNSDGSYSIPKDKYTDGHQTVVYHVAPETGSLTVSVVNEEGQSVGIPITTPMNNQDIINSNGSSTTLTGYTLPETTIAKLKKEGYELVPKETTIKTPLDSKAELVGNKDLSKVDLIQGTTKITYVVKKIPVVGTVGVKVYIEGDKTPIINTPDVQSNVVGTAIDSSKTAMPKLPAKYKNYHLVKTVITTPNGETPKSVDGVKITKGNTEVTYTIAPNKGSLTVTVNIVNSKGVVISTPVKVYAPKSDTNVNEGTSITGANLTDIPNVPKGYHLVSSTIEQPKGSDVTLGKDSNGKANGIVSGTIPYGDVHVVYTIEKDAPVVNKGIVTSTVVGTDGTVYTPVHDVTKDGGSPIGTEVTGSGVTITPPANTKITKVTVDGKEVKATPNSNGTYSIPSVKVNTKEQHIVWTVQKIGNVDVTVQIVKKVGDKYVVESTPVSNKQVINEANDGTNITGANYSDIKSLVPAGYHLVASSYTSPKIGNVTLGTGSNLGTVTGTVEQGTTHIVYQIVKDTPAPKKGNVTVEIKTTSGKILIQPHEVTSGKVGDKIDGNTTSIVVPKGYHISGTNTVDGSPVNITTTTNKEGQTVVNVPDGNFKDGTTKIVYTVTKDTPVVNTGNVVVTINEVGANGHLIKTIVKGHSVMSDKNVGTEITGANYSNVESLVPAGYHLVSSSLSKGADASVDKGVVTGQVVSGTTEVIYNITKNAPKPKPQPKTGSVVTNIVTTDGTVVSHGTPITRTTGKDITAGDTAYNPPKTIKGYHVVGLTVNGKPIKSVNGAYKVPSGMTFGDGTTQHVTWIIGKDAPTPKPQPKTGNVVVTINIVDANGNVISTPVNNDQVVNGAEVGSAITGANYNTVATANNIPAGYHLVKTVVTNPNGKTQTYTAGVVGGTVQEGTIHVVYSIEKDAPTPSVKPDVKYGNVKVTVVTTNGDVLVPNHLVEKNVVGTEVTTGIGYENIPGYTLTGTTVDGAQKGAVSVSKVTLPDGTIQIIYTVTKNQTTPVTPMQKEGSVKVEVVTASGKIVVPNHTVKEGTEGTVVTDGVGYNNIPGYHLLGTSVNGNDKGKVSISTVTLTDGTTQIIYTIGKDATPVKPTPENPPVKPTPENPPVQQTTGKVTVKVVNTNGDVVVGTHTVSQGVTGGEVTGTGYNPPAGYKITKITIDGKEVKYVPSMEIPDGTTSIIYTIGKDVKPTPDVKYGNVTIKVVTESGKVIVEQHEVANGIVGTQVTSSTTNYKVPNGYHLVKETVNGKEVSSNSDITLTDGTTKIVYVIAKNVVKPDTGNGIVNPPVQPEVKPDGGDSTVNPPVQPNSGNNANVPEIVPPLTGDKTGTVIITPEPTENNTPVVVNNISNVNEIPVVRVNSNTTAKISGLADTGTDESSNNATKDLAGLAGLVAVLGLGFLLKRKK